MPTTHEILVKAKALLEASPKAWLQGRLAATDTGDSAFVADPEAKCFCTIGAVMHAAQTSNRRAIGGALECLADIITPGHGTDETDVIVAFNDDRHTTRCDVLNLFEKAIESC